MTLSILLIRVAIAAALLTLLTYFGFKKKESLVMSYVQNFCGALFIFSGWVKAIDPLGTAYKLVDYFDQFEAVFAETWFGFLAPMFPFLATYKVPVSVFVIVFEIVLGLMLIIGHKPKFTAWSFFLLVLFFTALTGFTFLTGYVPPDANFFSFSSWGAYDAANMKVTDCGCFGDFLKLEPKVSFLKDVFLLFPAVFFLLRSKTMHQIFHHNVRSILVAVATIGLLVYSISNYSWDLPHTDFRPFKIGVDVAEQRKAELDAQSNVQIMAYRVENKTTGEVKEIPYAEYLKTFKDYPKEEWNLDQISTEPTLPLTKLGEFDLTGMDHESLNSIILENEDPTLLIVAYELFGDGTPTSVTIQDTIYGMDTILAADGTMSLSRNIQEIRTRTEQGIDYQWKDYYADRYTDVVLPFVKQAEEADWDIVVATAGADEEQILDFKEDIGLEGIYGSGDDKLLKTIVRSNPGIVLIQNGKILDKWHYKKLPSFNSVTTEHF